MIFCLVSELLGTEKERVRADELKLARELTAVAIRGGEDTTVGMLYAEAERCETIAFPLDESRQRRTMGVLIMVVPKPLEKD